MSVPIISTALTSELSKNGPVVLLCPYESGEPHGTVLVALCNAPTDGQATTLGHAAEAANRQVQGQIQGTPARVRVGSRGAGLRGIRRSYG
jgi:hypothetical protein